MEGSPEGKTGSATVETHHRLQLGLLGALEEILRQGKDRALADETLARFVDFTRVHFQAEEALMALAEYSETAAHAAAHSRFLAQAREMQRSTAGADPARDARRRRRARRGAPRPHHGVRRGLRALERGPSRFVARKMTCRVPAAPPPRAGTTRASASKPARESRAR